MLTRRSFFGLSGAAAAALAMPGRARAASASKRKFIFVYAQGGWDPTRVFADGFDIGGVDMEVLAERATAGGISYVDHPDRPSVRAFFEQNHARSVVFNGVMVRSIAHEICTMISLTGTSSGVAPDWPAVIAARQAEARVLPHLVLGGPSFPGDLGVYVARTGSNGQLEALLSGDALDMSDIDLRHLRSPSQKLVDGFVAGRAAARADFPRSRIEAALLNDFDAAVAHMQELKDLQFEMDFSTSGDLESQVPVAVDALAKSVSRCLTLSAGTAGSWDTHAQNDDLQSPLWESLFSGILQLQAALAGTADPDGGMLLDNTSIVVLSEMGRTPALNGFIGKDHWPFTSVLLVGDGVTGDRVVGGWDDNWYGTPVDPATGETDETGQILSSEAVGATLLALADIDPGDYVSGVDPISGVLA
jgi:hypothetical protein